VSWRFAVSTEHYGSDLAFIHDAGFGDLGRQATGRLIEELASSGHKKGRVVDIGCGSGILARALVDAGYEVLGLDISAAMIEQARARVPEADFRVASFVSADLPECVAVSAIGEVLSYRFDAKHNDCARKELFCRIHGALVPGGLLLFDMATPDRGGAGPPRRTSAEGPDWAVFTQTSVGDHVLKRQITSFRKAGELYRRGSEVHELALVEPALVLESLCAAGFDARVIPAYGTAPLPQGLVAFLARK
jgi:SAM-dependent methyltransferase